MSAGQGQRWHRLWPPSRGWGGQQIEDSAVLMERVAALEREVEDLRIALFEAQSFIPRLSALVDYVLTELGDRRTGQGSGPDDGS